MSEYPPIHQSNDYAIDRDQWSGYITGRIELNNGKHLRFTTLAAGFPKEEGAIIESYQTTPAAAWKAFDLGLRDWLKDKPGVILWRHKPTLEELTERVVDQAMDWGLPEVERLVTRSRFCVFARIAVTENRAFLSAENFVTEHSPA